MKFVTEIYNFNRQAGLLDKPYNDFLESSFQIEEALEGFSLFDLVNIIRLNYKGEETPKEYARLIIGACSLPEFGPFGIPTELPDVERLDKAIDAIIYAVGSIAKLRLNPEQIERAVLVVTQANLQKLSMPKDEFGKLQKPVDFVGPEVELQKILDERDN